jgi:hypothetical protein
MGMGPATSETNNDCADKNVNIVKSYGLDGRSLILGGGRNFSLCHNTKLDQSSTQAPIQKVTGVLSRC